MKNRANKRGCCCCVVVTSSVNYEVQITPFEEKGFSQPDLPTPFCPYSMNLFQNTFFLSWKRLMWIISFTEMVFNG